MILAFAPRASSGVLPNQYGPCTFDIALRNNQYLVTAQANVGGYVSGQQTTNNTADFATFFQPFINLEQILGYGTNCVEPNNANFGSQQGISPFLLKTPLTMVGHGIYFVCHGWERDSDGEASTSGGSNPCSFQYVGTKVMQCIFCWGETVNIGTGVGTVSSAKFRGGGMANVFINCNFGALDCVDAYNIHDWNMYLGGAVNGLQWSVNTFSNQAGGISHLVVNGPLLGGESAGSVCGGALGASVVRPAKAGGGLGIGSGVGQSFFENIFTTTSTRYGIQDSSNLGQNNILANHIEFNAANGCYSDFKDGTALYIVAPQDLMTGNTITGGTIGIYNNANFETYAGDSIFIPGGPCIQVGGSDNVFTGQACVDNGSPHTMTYGLDLSVSNGVNNTITGTVITGWTTACIGNFYTPGTYNGWQITATSCNPIGKITNFIGTNNLWGPPGTSSTITASTVYTIRMVSQAWTCASNGSVGGGVTIKDASGNVVVNNVAISTFCGSTTNPNPVYTAIGWTVTFGAFTSGPPLVTDFGL